MSETVPATKRAKSKPAITARQGDVLKWVKAFIKAEGVPPTRREIGSGLGIQVNAVQEHLGHLERAGFISVKQGSSRGIFITTPRKRSMKSKAVRETSIDAYKDLIKSGKLSAQEARILSFMKPGRDYSLQELCQLTGLAVNAVSGRVSGMKKKLVLQEAERRPCTITKNSIKPVRLVPDQLSLPLQSETPASAT